MRTIIILGLPRTGTSVILQMLQAGGYPCFGEAPSFEPCLVPEIPWNKVKGKAIKLLDPQGSHDYPPPGDYYVIKTKRNEIEQAKSNIKLLRAVGVPVQGSSKEINTISRSILQDNNVIASWAKKQKQWIEIPFEDILKDPEAIAFALQGIVGDYLSLNIKSMISVVKKRSSKCYPTMLELDLIEEAKGKIKPN